MLLESTQSSPAKALVSCSTELKFLCEVVFRASNLTVLYGMRTVYTCFNPRFKLRVSDSSTRFIQFIQFIPLVYSVQRDTAHEEGIRVVTTKAGRYRSKRINNV